MEARIYLDHAATTPMLPAARDAVAEGMARWANPSSPHAAGRAARAALEEARARIAAALGWPHALIFTSGATEAIEIALRRGRLGTRQISAVEHDAVRRAAPDAQLIPVDGQGLVDPAGLNSDGALVCVQHVNSETGVIQPLDRIAAAVRSLGGLLLADCAQSAGKLPLPDADFIIVSAHKLGGPPGIGALLVRDIGMLTATGGQEQGYRAGTENLPGALGFAAALQSPNGWLEETRRLRQILEQKVVAAGGIVVASGAPRLATIGACRMRGMAATAQLIRFDMAGIAVSAGSACSSGSLKPSAVLSAMGLSEAEAGEVIRVSFGPRTSQVEVMRFADLWTQLAGDAKARIEVGAS